MKKEGRPFKLSLTVTKCCFDGNSLYEDKDSCFLVAEFVMKNMITVFSFFRLLFHLCLTNC